MHSTLLSAAAMSLSLATAFPKHVPLLEREGINCEGSVQCEAENEAGSHIQALADAMRTAISNGQGGNFYSDGRQSQY